MGELVIASSSVGLPRVLPSPRVPIRIRPGTMDDIPFIDSLQKLHTRQVGWMPTATFAGKIKLGHVLVAWASRPCSAEDMGETAIPPQERVGYLIGNDQYFKRDDVGIIYQLNVSPGVQRGLIGAALLKAQFARSAYGCRLYCCWCAQDIAANHFWEAMGFVPLAFRAGSRTKGKDASGKSAPRVHIFWQKRICSGDTGDVKRGGTPWWFPSKTTGGAIREDRIVLPIPPGTHWSDAKPLLLPGMPQLTEAATPNRRALPGPRPKRLIIPAERLRLASNGGLRFAVEGDAPTKEAGAPRSAAAKVKHDPQYEAAARELRDRWLERVNSTPMVGGGKYDLSREIEAQPMRATAGLLEAA